MQLMPDEDRIVLVAALTHYCVQLEGRLPPDQLARAQNVLRKVVGADKRVWVDDTAFRWVGDATKFGHTEDL